MDVLEHLQRHLLPFRYDVHHLATNHAKTARSTGHTITDLLQERGWETLRQWGAAQDFEGMRQQRITRENGHGVTIDFMIRELATTIVVIVHGWQVIMHHRVRVNVLQGTGGRQHCLTRTTDGVCRSQREDRQEALPP